MCRNSIDNSMEIPIGFPHVGMTISHRIPTCGNDDFPQDSHMWE